MEMVDIAAVNALLLLGGGGGVFTYLINIRKGGKKIFPDEITL